MRMQRPLGLFVRLPLALAVLLPLLLSASPVLAAPGPLCYVRIGGPGPDGNSWATAYGNPQDALADDTCEEIWVAQGTYLPDESAPGSPGLSFGLKTGVEIYGGFLGTETQRDQRNWVNNETILSGDIGIPGDATDNSYYVVRGDTAATAVLDGFTIRGGHGRGITIYGGGIYIANGHPTLRNLWIVDNRAAIGGGMFVGQGSPSLSQVVFEGNIATAVGGGMYAQQGSPLLTDVFFDSNQAIDPDPDSGRGGGLLVATGTNAVLNKVTFSNNSAQGEGGGLYNAGNTTITNATLRGNTSASMGGAIHVFEGSVVIHHASFENNSGAGDSITLEDGTASVVNSAFGNTTGAHLNLTGGTLDVNHSVLVAACPVIAGLTCTNVLTGDPQFGPLQEDGGFTPTMALGASSAALDTADLGACAAADQRGVPRPRAAGCDMGAYEVIDHTLGPRCYVDADATWVGNGSSWAHPYRDLQHALANTGCTEIWVAEGAYRPDGANPDDRSMSFVLKNGVEIYGGFEGVETLRDERDWLVNITILSGEIGAAVNTDNSQHVVDGSNTNISAVLDGFTIRDGYADAGGSHQGGGMYISAGSPTLSDLIFTNNAATSMGGGLYITGGSPTMSRLTFTANTAPFGAGLKSSGSDFELTEAVFSGNISSNRGGGMHTSGATPKLDQVLFENNSAAIAGGGIAIEDSISLTNVTFFQNTAGSGGGGVLVGSSGTLITMSHATFSGNSPNAMHLEWGNTTVHNSIFWGHSSISMLTGALTSATINDSVLDHACPAGATCNNTVALDPLLGPLQDNGGFSYTMALDALSPAVDAAEDAACTPGDQRGVPRPQLAGCDMGAYEYDGAAAAPASGGGSSSSSRVAHKPIAPSGLTTLQFGRISVVVPASAIPAGQTNCVLTIQELGSSGEFGFVLDDTVWDVKVRCNNNPVSIFFDALTICIRPLDGVLSSKNVYHRHTAAAGFQAIHGGAAPAGFVCGQTRLLSLVTLGELALPATGFAQGVVTELGAPPEAYAEVYAASDLTLSIPKLSVSLDILGVPQGPNGWDVTWLSGNQAGYLHGTAFPTWRGNSVLTAHVWNADNTPGPFYGLKDLQHGDRFTISAYGYTYTYEVRTNRLVSESNLDVLASNEYSQITLITCETFSESTGGYLYRRAVSAVLVSVSQ